ncbi:sensor histidine kinase [Conexibacter woesei]|uniref:histidine kinase n=1 Tax=Conexibacter woesei (strain DSM 14684 / CCUG 47730 / CIP 108061 / JCM 11494 / NBRC 100937 / ID131577) TaxID=469383 RepID=D3F8I5_CONWI|nr:histidine kinase [Conexibacter woesei]ADB50949.1 histidine kinase [Conexibacter woesei DSM 14684]
MARQVLGGKARCSSHSRVLNRPRTRRRRQTRPAPPRRLQQRAERARLSAALQAQRRAIARDVHDGIAQELAFIAAQLGRLDQGAGDGDLAHELRAAARRALHEARLTIELLRAPPDVSFERLVEQAVATFQARFGVPVELRLELSDDVSADRERCTAVLRILGQALVNAAEHGTPRCVHVLVHASAAGLALTVTDDGAGDRAGAASCAPAPRGWGLVSMRERAELLGGSFSFNARPGVGAEVAVVLP